MPICLCLVIWRSCIHQWFFLLRRLQTSLCFPTRMNFLMLDFLMEDQALFRAVKSMILRHLSNAIFNSNDLIMVCFVSFCVFQILLFTKPMWLGKCFLRYHVVIYQSAVDLLSWNLWFYLCNGLSMPFVKLDFFFILLFPVYIIL